MTIKKLRKLLKAWPSDMEVYVWEGYNAGCLDNDLAIHVMGKHPRTGKLAIRIEGRA